MNNTFEYFKKELQACIDFGDAEVAHGQADNLLCEVAIAASRQTITEYQTFQLILLYHEVAKWYA